MILVEKLDENYIRLKTSEPHIQKELIDFFTFPIPNAMWMKRVRKGWDGKIRLLSPKTHKLFFGLLPFVEHFAKKNDYPIELAFENKKKAVDITDHLAEIKPKGLQHRNYQIAAVRFCINNDRGIILSPTASGKSLVIYALASYYQGEKVLILEPLTNLVEQIASDFIEYGANPHKIHKTHHSAVNERLRGNIEPVFHISTFQSLAKKSEEYLSQFGCVIGDEVHLYETASIKKILGKMPQCKYRFGTTGTLRNSKTHKLVLQGMFGVIHKGISTKELMDKKILADLKVHCVLLSYQKKPRRRKNKTEKKYEIELEHILTYDKRNQFIMNLAKNLKGNTLILFKFVSKHGKILYEQMRDIKGRKVFFIYGATETNSRNEIIKIVEKEKDAIIIASYGVFSHGANIKNLHNIILGFSVMSKITLQQSIGRGLRRTAEKTRIKVFDIADNLPYAFNQFQERLKIYKTENFNHSITKVNI